MLLHSNVQSLDRCVATQMLSFHVSKCPSYRSHTLSRFIRCYLFHVTAFSLVGQLRIRRAELLNYRELYEERVAQRDEAGELPGPEEVRFEWN